MVFVEKDAFAKDITDRLTMMGHIIKERGTIGAVETIMVRSDGTLEGVADNRGDDDVRGY